MAATGTRWQWGKMATMGQDGCHGGKVVVGQDGHCGARWLWGKMAAMGARWLQWGQGGRAKWPLWE